MKDWTVLAAGALLASLAFPNEWFPAGWGFLAPAVLVPAFWFSFRRGPAVAALGGALWAVLTTLASQGWLLAFHPYAFPLVLAFEAPWYAAAFAAVSWAARRRPAAAPWSAALLWTFFEFLRLQGFFAYPYGAVASAFWAYPVTFQSAWLVGTSGLTFLLAWSAAWAACLLTGRLGWGRLRFDLAAGLGLWAVNLGGGALRLAAPDTGPLWRPALVQHAQDPWKGGASAYEAGLETLLSLSDRARSGAPDAVVWSETAFVPSVEYHSRYRENAASLGLVRRLEAFLAAQKAPFVIGNDHREKTSDGTTLDYNAVLAWTGRWSGRYEKNRLVPFTEAFPYKEQLPGVYRWLQEADTHFWEPGRGQPLLDLGAGVRAGTPVCYEDSFPDLARSFARQGATVLVNLTDDAWAPGRASRMQHLALAVFRAAETGLPLVRAGNDGATASVSSRGELLALLPVGPPGVLQAEVRLGGGDPAPSVVLGDLPAWTALVVFMLLMLWPMKKEGDVDKPEQL